MVTEREEKLAAARKKLARFQQTKTAGHQRPPSQQPKLESIGRGVEESNSSNDLTEEQDLSFLIKKVEFQIHHSFPDPLITITEAPFEIHNAGYGEFPITITIYFQDPYERPLEYTH